MWQLFSKKRPEKSLTLLVFSVLISCGSPHNANNIEPIQPHIYVNILSTNKKTAD